MRWLVGLDRRGTCGGALQLARWLVQCDRHELAPLHVIESSVAARARHPSAVAELEATARADVRAALARADLGTFAPEVVFGTTADLRLAEAAAGTAADGILLGMRTAPADEGAARLGRVARRLVRQLPCPVVVVPPDVRTETIGRGPILLASDLGDSSGAAARFAVWLGRAIGRAVVVVHVIPQEHDAERFLPAVTAAQLVAQLGLDRRRDLQLWKATHELAGAPSIVAEGAIVERLRAIAEAEHAPIVVCGSRGYGTLRRIFVASTATDLARVAGCAVAIVPSS